MQSAPPAPGLAILCKSPKWFQGIINHARPPLIKLNACTGGLGNSTCVAFPSGRGREALLPLYDLILIKNALAKGIHVLFWERL